MKVLIIGLGSIGRKHINVLRELKPDVDIFALRSSKKAEIEDRITNIYSLDKIPPNISFFLVSNPTIFHQETIWNLIKFNKPLFIEKPVLHELNSESFEILNEIKGKNIFTYVGCPLRFHPCIQYLKTFLKEERPRINEVSVYCGSFLPDWRPERNFREIYSSRPELGGGVHLDLIHELDYTYFLFGKPLKVTSELCSKSSLKIPAIDYAHYWLDYVDFSATVTLNYYRPKPKRTLELVFENSIWNVDLIASTIMDENENIVFSEHADQYTLMKTQMSGFLEVLEEGKPSQNSFEESIEVLKICLNQIS